MNATVRMMLRPAWIVEAFAVSNIAFLAVDIGFAHAANRFAHPAEWIPIVFSIAGAVLLVPALISEKWWVRWRTPSMLLAVLSIVVGVAGMIFHLESAFFEKHTLERLVYSAPFIAPLAYVGVGLLILLSRLEERESASWSWWVLFLAFGGFVGNFGLSVFDHAQNGFFRPVEWISVVSAAFAASFLFLALWKPDNLAMTRASAVVLAIQVLTGVAGFVLHVAADLNRPGAGLLEKLIYGAPAFAPLLFADLAMLAGIGLWSRIRQQPAADH
jgi:hypothetical protein